MGLYKKIAWSWLTPDQESPIYLDFISNNHKAKQQVNYTNTNIPQQEKIQKILPFENWKIKQFRSAFYNHNS